MTSLKHLLTLPAAISIVLCWNDCPILDQGLVNTATLLAQVHEGRDLFCIHDGNMHHSQNTTPAPPDNPLKGFVPYLRADATFAHSLEWDYTRLADVMPGPTNFNWAPFDAKLNAATSLWGNWTRHQPPNRLLPLKAGAATLRDRLGPRSLTICSTYQLAHADPGAVAE